MLWIKRNLLFVLSLAVTVGLFLYGGYYMYTQWDENSQVQAKLSETDDKLKKIYEAPTVFPSQTNIAILKQQEGQMKAFLAEALKVKTPVEFDSKISPANFKTLLDNSLAELNRDADRARIPVAQREFSFSSIKPLVSFAEGSVPMLAEQLADIKMLTGILFNSEITSLENLRREPVSKDDATASGSVDYHTFTKRTNDITGDVSSFYFVTFQGFSESLAQVLNNLQRSPHGLSVRLLSVLPGTGIRVQSGPGGATPPGAPPPAFNRQNPGAFPPPGGRPPGSGAGAPAPQRRLETLADEKAFRVSMLVEVAKPAPAAAQ